MSALRNIRLTLAYDGTNYCGWQVQPNGPTIQAMLEAAIEELTGEEVAVCSAGRTDSGVHALGQVANFHTASTIPAENFRPALQTCLPPDIVILDSCEAAAYFHATFSAKRKHYRYVIDNSPVALPFLRNYTCSLRRPLAAEAMHAAAQVLVGTHDFRSFETDFPNKATSVRTVTEISVSCQPHWSIWQQTRDNLSPSPPRGGRVGVGGAAPTDDLTRNPTPFICLDITADGFLYNMVRSIAGTLINVGRGKWTRADVEQILRAQRRSSAGATAPACGLYLVDVDYRA